MDKSGLLIIALGVAAFMIMLMQAGLHPELRAAIRTTLIIALAWSLGLVWSLGHSAKTVGSFRDLPWPVQMMLALSVLAVGSAWYVYLHAVRLRKVFATSRTDLINAMFAVIFAPLLMLWHPTLANSLNGLLLITATVFLLRKHKYE